MSSSTDLGSAEPLHARAAWIAATTFLPRRDRAALAALDQRLDERRPGGLPPQVLVDIDHTLYDNRARTLAILRDWLADPRSAGNPLRDPVARLELPYLDYGVDDSLANLGVSLSAPETLEALRAVEAYWVERFFANAYLEHDEVYPGAVAWLWTLVERGAEIVYLSGRPEPTMGEGTRRVFRRDGLPVDGAGVGFLLNPTTERNDLGTKARAVASLDPARIVAVVDNEPLIVVALQRLLPDALHFFRPTFASREPAAAGRGLFWLGHFAR